MSCNGRIFISHCTVRGDDCEAGKGDQHGIYIDPGSSNGDLAAVMVFGYRLTGKAVEGYSAEIEQRKNRE